MLTKLKMTQKACGRITYTEELCGTVRDIATAQVRGSVFVMGPIWREGEAQQAQVFGPITETVGENDI